MVKDAKRKGVEGGKQGFVRARVEVVRVRYLYFLSL